MATKTYASKCKRTNMIINSDGDHVHQVSSENSYFCPLEKTNSYSSMRGLRFVPESDLFSRYLAFMDELIETGKDVDLLIHNRII
ncbi:hypothetical protein LguiA_036585 [Lonicera macranthoides]